MYTSLFDRSFLVHLCRAVLSHEKVCKVIMLAFATIIMLACEKTF